MPYGTAGKPPERSLRDFGALLPAEQKLRDAALTGDECIVSGVRPGGDEKLNENTIRAKFIRFLVLGGDKDNLVHEHGVLLTGAYIEGVLDLMGCENLRPMFLRSCWFDSDVMLRDACGQTLNFDGSHVAGLDAKRARIRGSVYLRHDGRPSKDAPETDEARGCFETEKGLNIVDAHITGSLECHNAHFGVFEGKAIFASRAYIGGSVFLHQTFAAEGPIIFRGATIGGNFECSGGRFQAIRDEEADRRTGKEEGSAISCQGADIKGSVYFHEYDVTQEHSGETGDKKPFTAFGEVRFIDAKIGGSFECHGARITNPAGYALYCSRMSVSGSVFLHQGFIANGEVVFRRAAVGGNFDCSTGNFTAVNTVSKQALSCKGAHISGSVLLHKIVAKGQLCFVDATVNGSFECHGALIENPDAIALHCSRLKVNGSVLMHQGFTSVGAISFRRADVKGNLDASSANLQNRDGKALTCESAHITGSALMCNNFTAEGEVNFIGADIESDLDCDGGRFQNPGGSALICERAKIMGKASLSNNFLALGLVSFAGAEIEDSFVCAGGRFINPTPEPQQQRQDEAAACANALNLRGVNVNGALGFAPMTDAPPDTQACIWGSLDLRDAKANVLMDEEQSWPPRRVAKHCWDIDEQKSGLTTRSEQNDRLRCHIHLDGFVYSRFGGRSYLTVSTRKRWLGRQPDIDLGKQFKPQPFEQLVKVFRNMGHAQAAHVIAIEKERHHQRQTLGRRPWWTYPYKLLMLVFDGVAGYGYRSHRVVFAAIVFWLFCAGVYRIAAEQGVFTPKDQAQACACTNSCGEKASKECPPFLALAYSLDVMLPFDLHHESAWDVDWQKNPRISVLPPGWRSLIFLNFRDLDKVEFPSKYVDMLRSLEIIFGWIVGVILAALLGSKMNRE
jgi:hypothetical protein